MPQPTLHASDFGPLCSSSASRGSRAALPHLISRLATVGAAVGVALSGSLAAWGQGGGNANSVGLSMQNSANAAADQTNAGASALATPGGAAQPQAAPSQPGGMSTGVPTGLEGDMGMDYDPGGASLPSDIMYEDPYGGGGGGMPGARPGNAGLMGGLIGMFTRSTFEKLNRPGGAAAAPFQPNLKQRAALGAARGDQREALAYFHAHLVADREAAASDFNEVRYSPLTRRPTWALRAGVSMTANIADDLEGDAEPPREGMTIEDLTKNIRGPQGRMGMRGGAGGRQTARGRSSSGGAGGGAGGFSEPGGSEEEAMAGGGGAAGPGGMAGGAGMPMPGGIPGGMPGGMAPGGIPGGMAPGGMPGMAMPGIGTAPGGMPGMAGTGAATGFDTGGGDGFMEMAGDSMAGMGAMGTMPGMGGPAGMGNRNVPAYTPIDTKSYTHAQLEEHAGMMADLVRNEVARRAAAGEFGTVLPALASEADSVAAKYVMTGGRLAPPGKTEPMTWIPGVDFLGVGPANRMIESAREQGIELLFHFDIVAKSARSGEPQFDGRFRLIDTTTGKTLAVSRTVNKREALTGASRRSLPIVIGEMLQPAFDGIDSRVLLRPMPPLQPQHAAARIDTLLASSQPDRIDRLAEIVMFHHQGLINDDQLDEVFYFAAGEDGLRLLHDSPEKRQEIAERFVARLLEE